MAPFDIDLNADCGESLSAWAMPGDEEILGVVTSANVACGFHAGDPTVARRTCTVALRGWPGTTVSFSGRNSR